MSWHPKKCISYFEPGCIQCSECGWKSDDPWSTDPEDLKFEYDFNQWTCLECIETRIMEESQNEKNKD